MNAQILQEAADWLVDMRDGTADERTRAQFAEWLCKSPEHGRAYLELDSMWRDASALELREGTSPEALIRNANAAGSVVAFEELASVRRADEANRGARATRASFAIAASIVLACVAGAIGWWQFARFPVYETEIGEQRSITLVDGSIIELNARSRLKILYSERERKVALLEGQGLFRVASDARRPFVVYSDDVRVRAVGTQFDVHRKAGGTIVTVIEGRVQVSGPSAQQAPRVPAGSLAQVDIASTELRAGQQVQVAAAGMEQPTVANLESATAWTHRQVVFESASLADVAREFNRYNHRQLRIEDAALGHVLITGVFSSSDSTSLLRFLREQPDLVVEESETEVRITARR